MNISDPVIFSSISSFYNLLIMWAFYNNNIFFYIREGLVIWKVLCEANSKFNSK